MAKPRAVSKETVLETAFHLAEERGLGALNVRAVAEACGVAVGTVYHSYPSKAALMSDVIARFWRTALADCMPDVARGGSFVALCEEVADAVRGALKRFREDWLAEAAALGTRDRAAAHAREEACFAHIRAGLLRALESDPRVERASLTGPLAPEALVRFVWAAMLDALARGDGSEQALFALLRTTLYRS